MDNQVTNAEKTEGVVDISFQQNTSKKKKLIQSAGAALSIVLGVALGYAVASKTTLGATGILGLPGNKTSSSDSRIPSPSLKPEDVRDSAVGVVKIKPEKDKNIQGSHILQRDDSPWPVYIISNLVDLSAYEGKHVKVLGFTYGCGPSVWCLEVNKVEGK